MFQYISISGHRINPIITTINSPIQNPIIPTSRTHFSYSFPKPFRFSVSSPPSILAHKGSEVEFEKGVEEEDAAMTITPAIRISDRKLIVKDNTILTNVPDNIITTSGTSSGPLEGIFLGAEFNRNNFHHVTPLGKLQDVKFLSCFRFKLWWMAQKMGNKGSEIPMETQFLLVQTKDTSHIESDNNDIVYAVFLPLIEGSFRAVLQGNSEDELELCLESGDKDTVSSAFYQTVYVHAGCDPFVVITEAIRAVKLHLKTFRQRHEKKLPKIVDYFGWCTWDAFYQEVTQEGVEAGLESLTAGGGRVELTKQYHQALDASVARNFPDNGCIACMSHSTDALYCDAPGKHNFDVLRKLVLPDGTILRARLPGRPTKDSLFSDPSRDGVSLLKIWNMNKYTGVLGVYNCQGAAWSTIERKNTFHKTNSEAITGYIRGRDVHFISEAAVDPNWSGDCVLYSHGSAELVVLPYNAAMPVSFKILEHETYTVTPIKVLAPGFSFAPLGLIDMYNGGGAIEGLKYEVKAGAELSELEAGYQGEGNLVAEDRIENLSTEAVAVVSMEVKGCGQFGAYSSVKPRKCSVGGDMVDFTYDSDSGLLTLNLVDMPPADQKVHIVEVV
ncbi:hypothetical protein RND71_009420 [Anisodus tanguticus]|uniref:Galactinol--sucrose galactosyltransferase n=1 Tax=Anisodus tanguticus TaxID=243964 RepID=A0AAE1SH79_9SOLA|nr:hypothetical protein RND71_009420 [Anisodus tanguticus]